MTKPFDFEGRKRTRLAEEGLTQLKEEVDTLIVIPNQKVISVSPHDQTYVVHEILVRECRVERDASIVRRIHWNGVMYSSSVDSTRRLSE